MILEVMTLRLWGKIADHCATSTVQINFCTDSGQRCQEDKSDSKA